MKAMILAAGRGSRMANLTQEIPKPLLPIAGKPIMQYVIELLVKHGTDEIGVNLFYLGDKIQNYFGDGSRFGTKIYYIQEKELTGTAGGVRSIAKVLKPNEPFFVLPSDSLTNFNLTKIYKFHKQHGGMATICSQYLSRNPLSDCGIVSFDKKTKLVNAYLEKPKTKEEIISRWTSTGVYLLNPEVIKMIPNKVNNDQIVDIPLNILPKLIGSDQLYAFRLNKNQDYLMGINKPEEIFIAESDLNKYSF